MLLHVITKYLIKKIFKSKYFKNIYLLIIYYFGFSRIITAQTLVNLTMNK